MKSVRSVKRVFALVLCISLIASAQALVFAEDAPEEAFTRESVNMENEVSCDRQEAAPTNSGSLLTFPGRRYYSQAFEVLRLVNQERAKSGLPALRMDADLLEGAMVRGAECVFMFSHYRPNDSWCITVSDKAFAENIAMGQRTAAEAMTSWMNSTGHRKNIMGNFTSIGVGCFYYEGMYYWVQLFGTNSISSDCPQPQDLTKSWEIDIPGSRVFDQYTGTQRDFDLRIVPDHIGLEEGEVYAVDLYGRGNGDDQYFARDVRFDRNSVGWSLDSAEAATVDEKGNVKGLAPGTAALYAGPDPEKAPDSISVVVFRRIAGKNRYETAYAVAEQLKASLGVSKFENIVIASGEDYADALAGAYLAKVKNAPILLVNKATIDRTAAYAKSNLMSGGTVYILGGPGAVPGSMDQALSGVSAVRLAGTNRYLTNIEILKAAGVSDEDILVCSGAGFPDALSASAVGLPILLTGTRLLPEQEDMLDNLHTGRFRIIGGTAVVTVSVENELRSRNVPVDRISGANRYITSTAVAREFFGNSFDNTVLAYADDFPDGLAGGPAAMALGAPLILVKHGNTAEAGKFISGSNADAAYVLGGKSLIPNDDVWKTMTGK